MTSTSNVTAADRGRLAPLWLAVLVSLLSCAGEPSRLVFRVVGENLVPAWCDDAANRNNPACPAGAYRVTNVFVRVCQGGACEQPEQTRCVGNARELFCGTFVDGPLRSPGGAVSQRNVLPGDVVVAPRDDDSPTRVGIAVVATVRIPDGGAEYIRRQFVVPFVKGSVQMVEVWLSSLCIGAVCPPNTSCGRRSCEPIENPPTTAFTPLPDAGVADGGDRDVAFDVTPRDAPDVGVDAPTTDTPPMDVPVVDVPPDAPAMDTPVMDAPPDVPPSDTQPMDVAPDAAPMDASDAVLEVGDDMSVALETGSGRDRPVTSDGSDDVSDVADSADTPDVPSCGACSGTCCGSLCVDLRSNPSHCGACGLACSSGSTCCNGVCVSSATDCGGCNLGCRIGAACSRGRCTRGDRIAASGDRGCIVSSGRVACWGRASSSGSAFQPAPTGVALPRSVTGVAVGASHACAWVDGGSLVCWGDNGSGQLGGTPDAQGRVDHPTSLIVTMAAAHADTTCVVDNGSGVLCWGDNRRGQCAQSATMGGVPMPASVTLPSGVFARTVVLGNAHACALSVAGAVYCWGDNTYGQLGLGVTDTMAHPTPSRVGTFTANALVVGDDHTCALTATEVRCWGRNHRGQVGESIATTAVASPFVLPGVVPSPSFVGAAGAESTCVLNSANDVVCWGGGRFGELGRASGTGDTPLAMATAVPGLSGVTALAAGAHHVCALSSAGVSCWGFNRWGQVGDGRSGAPRGAPEAVRAPPTMLNATRVSVGGGHACAIAGGSVWCWGKNQFGQLARPASGNTSTPSLVPFTRMATSVCTGAEHTCVTLDDGSVSCWGQGLAGQLGIGAFAIPAVETPMAVTLRAPGTALSVVCGAQHTCAQLTDGSVSCWGTNASGQLGEPPSTASMRTSPNNAAALNALRTVSLAASGFATCALLETGAVHCWGRGAAGELGDGGATTSRAFPAAIPGVSGAVGVAGGMQHLCAWSPTTTWCWGANLAGQIGNGMTSGSAAPVTALTGILTPVSMAGGAQHTCAVSATGAHCWGLNTHGEVGAGTVSSATDRVIPSPALVPFPITFSRASSVGAGGGSVSPFDLGLDTGSSCIAIMSQVYCWGSNEWGELGDGAAFTSQPVDVVFPL